MTDQTIWHKCATPLFTRRTVDGAWTETAGQTWRRKNENGKWEYKQDEETEAEWLNRQW